MEKLDFNFINFSMGKTLVNLMKKVNIQYCIQYHRDENREKRSVVTLNPLSPLSPLSRSRSLSATQQTKGRGNSALVVLVGAIA